MKATGQMKPGLEGSDERDAVNPLCNINGETKGKTRDVFQSIHIEQCNKWFPERQTVHSGSVLIFITTFMFYAALTRKTKPVF